MKLKEKTLYAVTLLWMAEPLHSRITWAQMRAMKRFLWMEVRSDFGMLWQNKKRSLHHRSSIHALITHTSTTVFSVCHAHLHVLIHVCARVCVFVCIFKHTNACTSHTGVCVKRMAGLCDFRVLVNCRGSSTPAASDPSVTLMLINSFRCHHKPSERSHM